jgi:hypothetical protein
MVNRTLLEKEIKEYCDINEIKDIAGFMTQCLLTGFNIQKYGISPGDNIKRESGDMQINKENKSKKEKTDSNKLEVKKHKIKVREND